MTYAILGGVDTCAQGCRAAVEHRDAKGLKCQMCILIALDIIAASVLLGIGCNALNSVGGAINATTAKALMITGGAMLVADAVMGFIRTSVFASNDCCC